MYKGIREYVYISQIKMKPCTSLNEMHRAAPNCVTSEDLPAAYIMYVYLKTTARNMHLTSHMHAATARERCRNETKLKLNAMYLNILFEEPAISRVQHGMRPPGSWCVCVCVFRDVMAN